MHKGRKLEGHSDWLNKLWFTIRYNKIISNHLKRVR